ncbi:hypothetical protein NDU88_004787, partial [Pleurodeles waltl]
AVRAECTSREGRPAEGRVGDCGGDPGGCRGEHRSCRCFRDHPTAGRWVRTGNNAALPLLVQQQPLAAQDNGHWITRARPTRYTSQRDHNLV